MHGKDCGYSCILQGCAAEAAAAGESAMLVGNHLSAANAAHFLTSTWIVRCFLVSLLQVANTSFRHCPQLSHVNAVLNLYV
jgi:hypothetical protein